MGGNEDRGGTRKPVLANPRGTMRNRRVGRRVVTWKMWPLEAMKGHVREKGTHGHGKWEVPKWKMMTKQGNLIEYEYDNVMW